MRKIGVVIPTYNRKDCLRCLLDQLRGQVSDQFDMFTVVVVDGSTDGTLEMLETEFPSIHIVLGNGNWWWTRSVNEGCRLAVKKNADAVLLLNDDIELEGNYLQNLVKAAEEEPEAVIGSLNLTREKERRIFFSGAGRLRWWDGKLQKYHPFLAPCPETLSGLHHSIVLPGRGLLIPAVVFKTIDYFNEKALPHYKADYEFVLRANKHHLQTLISWDSVIYVQVQSTGAGATFTRQGFFTFFRSIFKKHSRTSLFRNFLYYKTFYPLWALPLFPFTAFIIMVRQFWLFIKDRKYK